MHDSSYMRLLLPLIALCVSLSTFAQEYFQQEVDYLIQVELDDERHQLRGDIAMMYKNNSPDSLPFIWMHLWPNAYSSPNTALAKQLFKSGNKLLFYQFQKVNGGIDSLHFEVNGIPLPFGDSESQKNTWTYHPEHRDIAKLTLSDALAPGDSILIYTPFRVKLPSGRLSRLGHVGQSYQITQWFPKPAVYDRDGWHEMPYLSMGEFYSEYGSFDVSISLPKNYVLAATGDMVEGARERAFLDSIAMETSRKFASGGWTDSDSAFPPSSTERKTIRFQQSKVHDFAWFADKRWEVQKGSVELENGHLVETWAYFTPKNAPYWKRAIEYLNDGTKHYSDCIGAYPYNHVSAVDGTISAGGGMEYPNITVIGNVNSDLSLETVIVHEVGHNWYYGLLGSNERSDPWMDEGFNSYHETRYLNEKYGDAIRLGSGFIGDKAAQKLGMDQFAYSVTDELAAVLSERLQINQAIRCHSTEYLELNYGAVVYKKTAVALGHLEAYLGKDRFDRAMQSYFDRWCFRHPSPEDVRASFEASTGEDLGWFFDDLVTSSGSLDYAIRAVKNRAGSVEVKVKNQGAIAAPFVINTLRDGKVLDSLWFPSNESGANVLQPNESVWVKLAPSDADRITLDHRRRMLESDRKNNSMRSKGLFRKVQTPQIRFLTGIEDPKVSQLFLVPIAAWNDQNKWMFGLHVHNAPIPFRDFEFALSPMYSFHSGTLTGFARASWYKNKNSFHLLSRSFRYHEGVYTNGVSYHQDYLRNAFVYERSFNRVLSSPLSSTLSAELVHFSLFGNAAQGADGSFGNAERENILLPRIAYVITLEHPFVTHEVAWNLRYGTAQGGQSGLYTEFAYASSMRYNEKGKRIHARVFGAYTADLQGNQSFFPLGAYGLTGRTDRFADHLFLSRTASASTGWLGRQISNTQGAVKIPIYAHTWLSSASLELELPLPLPLSVFGGLVGYDDLQSQANLDYVAGISLQLLRDLVALHVPLVTRSLLEGSYRPQELITFELRLEKMNPHHLLRNALK